MGAAYQLIVVVLILNLLYSSRGATQLECDPYQCIDQQVRYQCNVTGSSTMLWRVINGGVTLDDAPYLTGSTPSFSADVLTDAPEFSTILSSTSSTPQMIVSSIIFTGQTSINGYTIECDDLGGDKENCPIVIPGIPSSPDTVTIHTDTFTNSSVNISWTESSSPCVTGYRYNISSSALGWDNIIMESNTSNSAVILDGLVPSNDQYSVVVTAIDTANRTSSDSDPVCFIFNVPQFIGNLDVNSLNMSIENETSIEFRWEIKTFDCPSTPIINSFEASLLDDNGTTVRSADMIPVTAQQHTFYNISNGRNYTITFTAENGVGVNSTVTTFDIDKLSTIIPSPNSPIDPQSNTTNTTTTTISTTSVTSTSPTMPVNTTVPEDTTDPLEPPVIVGIVAGGIILILVITVVVLVVVYCVCCKKDHGSADFMTKASDPIPLKEKPSSSRAQPETGQVTYEDPGIKVQHKKAPTGELYAEPEVKNSGRRPPPQPTYQDPNTIQRQQAPTGDMYAMPEKKPAYSQVKKPGPGEVYADLDMSSVSPRSPQPLIPSESQQQQQVLYSDVRHH